MNGNLAKRFLGLPCRCVFVFFVRERKQRFGKCPEMYSFIHSFICNHLCQMRQPLKQPGSRGVSVIMSRWYKCCSRDLSINEMINFIIILRSNTTMEN